MELIAVEMMDFRIGIARRFEGAAVAGCLCHNALFPVPAVGHNGILEPLHKHSVLTSQTGDGRLLDIIIIILCHVE